MNTLPNELVEAILGLAAGAGGPSYGQLSPNGDRLWYADPLDVLVGRLRLASVCCLWRDLLHHRLLQLACSSASHAASLQPVEAASWIIARQQCRYATTTTTSGARTGCM
jgi:hypothetical protein